MSKDITVSFHVKGMAARLDRNTGNKAGENMRREAIQLAPCCGLGIKILITDAYGNLDIRPMASDVKIWIAKTVK